MCDDACYNLEADEEKGDDNDDDESAIVAFVLGFDGGIVKFVEVSESCDLF